MNLTLHTVQDDFVLNAESDLPRSTGQSFLLPYYLVDPSGNNLTDPSGNRLIGYEPSTIYAQILHAVQDDFVLTSE